GVVAEVELPARVGRLEALPHRDSLAGYRLIPEPPQFGGDGEALLSDPDGRCQGIGPGDRAEAAQGLSHARDGTRRHDRAVADIVDGALDVVAVTRPVLFDDDVLPHVGRDA